MSYDPRKSGPLPSTLGMSTMISGFTKLSGDEIERWFHDSWKYLSHGVVLVNVLVEGSLGDCYD